MCVVALALPFTVAAVGDEEAVSPAKDLDLWSLDDTHGCLADIASADPSVHGPDGSVNIHGICPSAPHVTALHPSDLCSLASDVLKVLSGFGKEHETKHDGDIDHNMVVDIDDLLYILKNFERECGRTAGFFG